MLCREQLACCCCLNLKGLLPESKPSVATAAAAAAGGVLGRPLNRGCGLNVKL